VLLLDEPLSALDANLREEMRVELKPIQRDVGIATVFVTHDQEEALAMSDKVVVMEHGVVEQVGLPDHVYRWPTTRFVANFLGHSNILKGRAEGGAAGRAEIRLENDLVVKTDAPEVAAGTAIEVVVRAHKVAVGPPNGHDPAGPANVFDGRVSDVNYLGGTASYFVDVAGLRLQVINAIDEQMFQEGDQVSVRILSKDCVLLDAEGRSIT
jgi:putative spermidine/putrescine transport system ATP-binding protein